MTEPAPAAAPLPPEPVLPPEEVDDLKPIYPAWLMDRNPRSETFGEVKPPKKPTPEFCRDAIATDERRHQNLIDRFRDDLRTYRLMDESMFEDLDPNDVELYTSAEPAFQVEKLANMVSGIDHIIQFPSKTQEEETDAQTLENFAYHFLDEVDTHHRAGGNAAYKWDLAFYRAVYGRMITRVLPDPTDPDFPWDVRMYDPATVFPVFGTKRGLVRVSCVYTETLDKVLQTYGDDPDVHKALVKKYTDEEGHVQLDRVGVVKEYWDAWWRWAEFDGEEILKVSAHELGRIPFIYTVGTGEPGNANLPTTNNFTMRERMAGLTMGDKVGDPNLAQKGLSFFHHLKPALRQEAAVFSILMTSAKQALAPPIGVESPYEDPPEPVDMSTGSTNKFRPGEKVVPLLSGTRPTDIGPLISALREQRVKGGLPDQMFGALEGSNVSGFAVESLIAAAKDRIQPVINDIEYHLASVIEMALYQYRNVGHFLVDNVEGVYHIPTQGRHIPLTPKRAPSRPQFKQIGQLLMQMAGGMPVDFAAGWDTAGFDNDMAPDQPHEDMALSRELILRIGTRPTVKLHSVALQNMTALANVASMLIERKVWSRTKAMEELNVRNPQEEWKRILAEDAQTNPRMLELVEFPQALYESGNIGAFLAYFATVVLPQLMGMMAPPEEGAPQEGGGPQTVQGDSQPMMNASPGRPADPGSGAPM